METLGQISAEFDKLDFKNNPVTHAPTRNSPLNVRIALAKLGVTLRFNRFSQEEVIEGLAGFTIVRDEVVGRLRSIFELEFHFSPPKDLVFEVSQTWRGATTFTPSSSTRRPQMGWCAAN